MNDDSLAWSTLGVRGEHATEFLDGQLTQSVRDVTDGQWSLLLDPDGTVVTSLWLRPQSEGWELLVPLERAERAETRLRRFLLRVHCVIERSEGATNTPLCSLDDLDREGWPWAPEFARDLLPHSYGRNFVDKTISFTKGCFTGQELVGRMDARGASTPWRFARATGPSLAAIANVIDAVGPDGPKGVTTVLTAREPVRAFAIVHRSFFTKESSTSEVVVEEIA